MKAASPLLVWFLLCIPFLGWTQSEDARFDPGFQAAIHVGGQVPTGILAERFGASNTVGLSGYRLTSKGWRLGGHYRFQTGADVREPGLLDNLRDANGHIVDNEGQIALVTAQQRGTLFCVSIGRIWTADFLNPGSGLLLELGMGFWEHKVHFQNRGNRLTQLDEPYVQGYDRLTGGWMLMPRLGYVHDSPNGLVRFQAGIESMMGRLQPNRAWNTDTMMADTGPRADRAVGLFAAWILRLRARSTDLDYYH
jgi:hypothetical protein